jgi:integrase
VLTLAEVLLVYLHQAEKHYRGPDGKPTSEVRETRLVVRALRELYAALPVAEFSPMKLKAVRQGWVNAGLSRSECNRRTNLVRRIFKWASAEELAPTGVYQGLLVVAGLQKGRTPARETEPVGPVHDDVVDATLPFMNRHVRGLVEFQRYTGCRPEEACGVRRCDLDVTGPVWLYRPVRHKTAWRGKSRVIPVGPKAQEVLRPFLTAYPTDFLFSPVRAVDDRNVWRSADRKTPRYPSHLARNEAKRVADPKRMPKEKYQPGSYGLAVARACDRAFPPPGPLAQKIGETRKNWSARLTDSQRAEVVAWRAAHRWHPNQLRHSFATRVRKEHGLEAAQVLLGHARADVTQVYAEKNHELAATVAARIG